MHYIIGCGGVGSAIVPSFCLLKPTGNITLVDGDTIERRNLNRQMFDASQVGQNKAQALAARYGCCFIPEWFARGKIRHYRNDWLICLVDNHRTRLETLEVCDETGCQAILAANEMHSAEAYCYRRQWRGTSRDPRVYYPELNTDRSGDPRAASIGRNCLYSELIDLDRIVRLQVSRASNVEFNASKQRWEVRSQTKRLLFSHRSRAICLAWEQQRFNLLESGVRRRSAPFQAAPSQQLVLAAGILNAGAGVVVLCQNPAASCPRLIV